MTEYLKSPELNVFIMVILCLFVFLNRKSITTPSYETKYGNLVLLIFPVLFSLYYRPLDGDFWASIPEVEGYGNEWVNHFEPFYTWLSEVVGHNYIMWRLIIWGAASAIVLAIYRKLRINNGLAIVSFFSFALIDCFYYLRNSLGFAVLYLAGAVFLTSKKISIKKISIIIGMLFLSWFLHRSMPLYIFLFAVAIFVPRKRIWLLTMLIAFPLLYGAIVFLSDWLLSVSMWMDAEHGLSYLQSSEYKITIYGAISELIRYMPFLYIIYNYIIQVSETTDRAESFFFLIAFILMYASFLFLGQVNQFGLQARLWNTAMMPFTFFIALYFQNHAGSKVCKNFVRLTVFAYAWQIILWGIL